MFILCLCTSSKMAYCRYPTIEAKILSHQKERDVWELEFDALLLGSEVAPEARRTLFKPCVEDHRGQMEDHQYRPIN